MARYVSLAYVTMGSIPIKEICSIYMTEGQISTCARNPRSLRRLQHPPHQAFVVPGSAGSGCACCVPRGQAYHLDHPRSQAAHGTLGSASMPCIDHAPPPPLTAENDVAAFLLVSRSCKVTTSSHHSPHPLRLFSVTLRLSQLHRTCLTPTSASASVTSFTWSSTLLPQRVQPWYKYTL